MCFGATVTTNRGQGQIRDGMSGGIPLPTTLPDAALSLEREHEIGDAL